MGTHMTRKRAQRAAIRGRVRYRLLAALAILGASLGLVTSPSARGASNGMWSVFPTTLRGQAPREVFQPVLTPGKPYSDSVTVANYTSAPLTFHLYGSDAFNTPGGGLSLRRRTDAQVDMGTWIKLPFSELTVPARSFTPVPFTILPPPQATPGDHVGGIVAEQTQGTTSNAGSVPITVVLAVGVRVYGRVVGPLNSALAIRHMSLAVHNSVGSEFGGGVGARVNFTLSNAGNTVQSPRARVELMTALGTASRRTFTINQLLPGNSLRYSLDFPGISVFGHLRAEVQIRGARAGATASASVWSVPWALIVVIVVGLVVLVVVLVRRRRRRKRISPDPEETREPEPAEI